MDVTIDKFGRIVIPKVVRDSLGLKAGSELQVEITEEETGERTIALRPGQEKALLIDEDGLLVYTGVLKVQDFDVVEHIRVTRDERAHRTTRR